MKNRKLTLTAVLVVLAAVVLTGGYMASNMGFKLNLALVAGSGSASGTNYIALPYNQQVGLNSARDLFEDIGGSVSVINQHRQFDDNFEFYGVLGSSLPDPGFLLTPGEGYIVKVTAAQNYVVVGSHDPVKTISFNSAGTASGTNYYAHPYHGVSANARELFEEIGGGVSVINQHRKLDDNFEFYGVLGSSLPDPGFLLTPGEAYIVKVTADTPFDPAHF